MVKGILRKNIALHEVKQKTILMALALLKLKEE